MRRMRMTVAALAAAGMVVTTAACSGDEGDVDGEGGAGGGTVNMQIGEIRSLIPGGSGESEGYRIIKNVYDGLVYYDRETGEPKNLVAEEITSPDNQVWTIKIKDGLTFHNGEPVNADAFIRSWDRTAYASNSLPLNYFFGTFEGYAEMNPEPLPEDQWADPEVPEWAPIDVTHLSGVTAVDDLTIEVKLSAPFIGFPTMLGYEAFYPVAEECLADTEACEAKPIGNGPFMFEEAYDIESGGTAVRWEDYAGDMPAQIDAVNWKVYLEGDDCWADFLTGDIDVCRPTAADYTTAMNDPDLESRHIQQDDPSILMLAFPLYDPQYQDVNLRRAISMAIDREGVANVVGPERFYALDQWVPDSILGGGTHSCGEYCTYDPEAAAALLADAGGWPEGEKMQIWVNDAADNVDIFRAIGDSISQSLGIEYELVTLDFPEFLATREEHNLDGPFRSGWGPDYNLNENYLEPIYGGGAAVNDQGWENAAYDAKILEAGAAATLDEAVALYAEAEAILAADMPSVPVFGERFNYFYTDRLENVFVHPIYSGPGGDCELREVTVIE
ncbi:peptide/nickel transport system substrate-binding protein/oligopeptide transport system substrate-binding protein [Glycomyces harbinensis]|uniref:Peptide/nickel transport system substrate-binding protein/oligopeptide transport system substrate-binding protein n=1 Tax=Glycomyces harbinensis TaxID=58114 RepID=A0A1G6U538_9ACTN|nr:peptide/nickel transport system substrate-binding protein/oligopeptide transport system substrate-binding protein [Glycomyces harbinensis]